MKSFSWGLSVLSSASSHIRKKLKIGTAKASGGKGNHSKGGYVRMRDSEVRHQIRWISSPGGQIMPSLSSHLPPPDSLHPRQTHTTHSCSWKYKVHIPITPYTLQTDFLCSQDVSWTVEGLH